MIFLVILSLGLLGITSSHSNDLFLSINTSRETVFASWMQEYQKQYITIEETNLRFKIFSDNYDYIQKQNERDDITYTLGLTIFADLTHKEFLNLRASNINLLSTRPSKNLQIDTTLDNFKLPVSVDWRTEGAVTPVLNEPKACGNAVMFTGVDAVSSIYFIEKGSLPILAYQQVWDCAENTCSDSFSNDDVFSYIQQNGLELATSYPIPPWNDPCQYKASDVFTNISNWTDVTSNNGTALAYAVFQQPVAVVVDAATPAWQFYTGGIVNQGSFCGTTPNHGLLIVGYSSQGGQNYWICKNSWGTSWGLSGYINIAQSAAGPGVCGINVSPAFPNL
jgi:C1A family cysteine protease